MAAKTKSPIEHIFPLKLPFRIIENVTVVKIHIPQFIIFIPITNKYFSKTILFFQWVSYI